MTAINNSDFEFDKYEEAIINAKFYRSKSHSLTVYTGFESKDHDGIYVLKIRDQLEIFESDSPSPFDMICNLEGKHSINSYNVIAWNELSGQERGMFMGV